MRLRTELLFFFVFFLLLLPEASPKLPDDMHEWAMASIDAIFKEDYEIAEDEAKKIIRKYPEHPAGYFFVAAVIDSWMSRFQTNKRETEFYRYCDQAIEKGEKLLEKEPGNQWARFFIGGADGFKGTYEARYERFITAFRYGWKGVSQLIDMAQKGSQIVDIQFGIGSYDYWRSALMKMLWWMPGVEDRRSVGIQKLRNVMENGTYTRTAAAMALVDIYLNENRFEEALELSTSMIRKHPHALVFYWGRAKALVGLKKDEEALKVFRYIESKLKTDQINNYYNAVVCKVSTAKCLISQGQPSLALEELVKIEEYKISNDIRKRLDKFLSEASSLKKQAAFQSRQASAAASQ